MKRIIFGATEYTPELDLNPTELTMLFKGVSRPENVGVFYDQILDWVDDLSIEIIAQTKKTIRVIFKLDYCNSASQKYFLMLLEKLILLKEKNFDIVVDWYYTEDDDKMLEDGEDIADSVGLEFCFSLLIK